jgi:hypothetical protein
MDEATIKAAVLNLIRRQAPSRRRPVVATEFQILSGQTRADLVALDDEFVGIEIKSKQDSLKRLRKQAHDYYASFDKTILVLDGRHLLPYLSIDFEFCDVWTFDESGQLRQFSEGKHHRMPEENFVHMLTLKEREIAFRDPQFQGKSKRETFFHFFKERFKPTSDNFWRRVRRRISGLKM